MPAHNGQLTTPPTPSSTDDLTLSRERTKNPVNDFLDRTHPRGGVPGWKACFGARYTSHLVAVIVLSRPSARHLDDGSCVEISRFARRDDRPANTGSWLIARARNWARLEGYDEVITYAGVAGNTGQLYQAAGFECDDITTADGGGWSTHGPDRDQWADYQRRRYRYEFGEQVARIG